MADEERTVDQVTSKELFESATAPPQAAPEPSPQPELPLEAPPPPAPPSVPEPPQRPEGIPAWRLKEESDARRLAEDRARQLEERYNQIVDHIRQSQKQPDFFENPDKATEAVVMRALRPMAEEMQRSVEESRRAQMYLGKMVASQFHGADTVEAAEQAFLKAREEQSLDPMDYERVVQSPNRYDAVVQWHKRQNVYASVGDDPAAWFEKQLEARMADPTFQAKVLERARASAAGKPTSVQLPPSLSKATAAAGNSGEPIGDMSDSSLFAFATKQ